MRAQIISKMLKEKFILKLRGLTLDNCIDVISFFLENNITVFEIIESHFSNLDVAKKVMYYYEKEVLDGQILVGAGGICHPNQILPAVKMGVSFVTMPTFSSSLIEICAMSNIVVIPGAVTPADFLQAFRKRVDFVQLFPAATFGPDYAHEILLAFPGLQMIASGGVRLKDRDKYYKKGVSLVSVGSDIAVADKFSDKKYLQRISAKLKIYF